MVYDEQLPMPGGRNVLMDYVPYSAGIQHKKFKF